MPDTSISALTARLATTASGWAAVIDGVLNIRTVTDSANAAAINALYLSGINVISNCRDSDCDCMVNVLTKMKPEIKLVPVTLEVQRNIDAGGA